MKYQILVLVALSWLVSTSTTVAAAVVTETFDFQASGIDPAYVAGGSVSGTVTVSYDLDETGYVALPFTFASNLPFAPTDLRANFDGFARRVVIGAQGLAGLVVGGTDDFVFDFRPEDLTNARFLVTRDGLNPTAAASGATSVVVTKVAAVPEPSTWSLMVGGFALVGSAWRRRRVLFTLV